MHGLRGEKKSANMGKKRRRKEEHKKKIIMLDNEKQDGWTFLGCQLQWYGYTLATAFRTIYQQIF